MWLDARAGAQDLSDPNVESSMLGPGAFSCHNAEEKRDRGQPMSSWC
jgi:hypothetical protein